ncbi:MAG: tetratricopeptide repeat protein [Caldilineaceae bacterium]|nr:tetratricopeptide repeat protein [Caldilineaceae bacterium]
MSPTRFPPSRPEIAHNLGTYRLQGFSGRSKELITLHRWLTDETSRTALAISGGQGYGKSTLATAAAWNTIHHFADGVIWVGPAGRSSFRLYDIVRTMDTLLGTTLTRVSQDRWGIGILEQLYRRKRLLILDELSGATEREIETLVEIIGHLQDSGGQSHVLMIDRDIHPQILKLAGDHHLALTGLTLEETVTFIQQRGPEDVRSLALRHVESLHKHTGGRPLSMRLTLGLLVDYQNWAEVDLALSELPQKDGVVETSAVAAFAVENFAAFWPQAGPLLDRLVSAAGGAANQAMHDLFWDDLGDDEEFATTLDALAARALVEQSFVNQRYLVQPAVRRYLAQGAVMLGEDWNRTHAGYYIRLARRYEETPLDRWREIDPEWGNIHLGADWCAERIERLWRKAALDFIRDPLEDMGLPHVPVNLPRIRRDLRLARDYALAMAHYAFWRHPPGILRWLAAGAVASLALGDMRDYGWLLANIGRQLFFTGEVEAAIDWLRRALAIFDRGDMMTELAYVHTDLGTSLRVLDEPRQALEHFWQAFEAVAQTGELSSLAAAYINLGSAYFSLHNYEEAVEQHRKALRIAVRMGNPQLVAGAHNNIGLALEGMERFSEAEKAYQEALSMFERARDEAGISTCYNNLGSVSYAQQKYTEALQWYEKDLILSEQRGTWMDKAATLHNLGHVALEQNDTAQALDYFARSRDLYAAFQLGEYVQEEEEMIEHVRGLQTETVAAKR